MFSRALHAIWGTWLQKQAARRQSCGARKQRARCRLCLEQLEDRTAPAIITVNTVVDNTTADTVLTLREGILVANGSLGRSLTAGEQAQVSGTVGSSNTIQFNLPGGSQSITLTGGALGITRALALNGPGAGNLTVSGNNSSRVFAVGTLNSSNLSLVVSMSGLTVANGNATSGSNTYGAGVANFATLALNNMVFTANATGSSGGGGIYNKGALTVSNTSFASNTTASGGGGAGLLNAASATVATSTFTGNHAASSGGGIYSTSSATLTVNNSGFTGNVSGSDGGAIDNDGTMTINSSLFANNITSSEGGGVETGNITTMTNCTIVGNTCGSRGGGIEVPGPGLTQLINCTITGNRTTSSSSTSGGGIYQEVAAKLFNTIVVGNFRGSGSTASDIGANVHSSSANNLIGTGGAGGMTNGASGNKVGISSPGLGTLANNGGPTQTIALQTGSLAINQGSNALVTATTDQRGLPRIVGGTVDIGAFEVQGAATASGFLTVTGITSPTTAGVVRTVTVTAKDANGNTAPGYTGTVHFTSSDAQAVLPADYTFVSGEGGVHTFNVTLKTAGSQSVTATDTATASITGTQSGIVVNPAGASTCTVAAFPSPIAPNAAGTVTVTVKDAFGNTVTGYTGTVHFTSSDGQAVLPPNYTFVSGDNGVHTFSVTLKTAGTQLLTATDTIVASITGSQTGIVVNAVASQTLITVNTVADNTTADSLLSLREAISFVNGTLGRSLTAPEQAQISGTATNRTIQFNLPTGPQTITLTGGALNITSALTINGPGATNLTINGNHASRVFVVGTIYSRNLSLVATINGLTVAGGSALSGTDNTYGAGLLNFGTLTLGNMVFTGNAAGSSGGGAIYNAGALTVTNSTFAANSADNAVGGAIYNNSSGVLTVSTSTFTGNIGTTGSSGGAISNSGSATITSSTFNGNTAASKGGAIYNRSTGIMTVTNSTFFGNIATGRGGAICNAGTLQVVNATITGNRGVSSAGGIAQDTPAKLFNTLVAGNFQGASPSTTASDIGGTVDATSAYNLIGTGGLISGVNNNQVGVANPGLGTLANNGGPTPTIALLAGSPALNQGGNIYVTSTTDQLGQLRIANLVVDIGAFEVQL